MRFCRLSKDCQPKDVAGAVFNRDLVAWVALKTAPALNEKGPNGEVP
jgi:hypothetical protein